MTDSSNQNRKLRVYLAYSKEDRTEVRRLYRELKSAGFDTWLDYEQVLPGQEWNLEIEKAVREADVVIVCLSKNSVQKEGYVQREVRYALDVVNQKPEGTIYLIPARLDDCVVPRALRNYQFVDLFLPSGYERLRLSLQKRAVGLGLREVSKPKPREVEKIPAGKPAPINLSPPSLKVEAEYKPKSLKRTGVVQIILSVFTFIFSIPYYIVIAPIVFLANLITKGMSQIIEKYQTEKVEETYAPLSNPYIAGNPIDPVSNQRMFFGRSDIVKLVYNEIKEPAQKPSLLLYGRRRMGKTSALLNLGRLMRDFSIVDIYISAQDIAYRTDLDLAFNLAQLVLTKLKGALFVEKLFGGEDRFIRKDNYVGKPILMLSDFLAECNKVLEINNLYCLFMFDEYELLGESISRDFFLQIRDTMQHKPRFVFLFAGSHMPNEVKNGNWMEVFMNVKVLRISFLNRQDSYKLLTEPVPNLKYANQNVINQILDITGCQPLMLQSMATEIVIQLNISGKRIVDEKVVNHAVEKTLDSWGFNFFTHLWENDCNLRVDKELLKKIALNNSHTKISSVENYTISLKKLVERDLLKVQDGYVKLTMPILKRWIQRESPEIH